MLGILLKRLPVATVVSTSTAFLWHLSRIYLSCSAMVGDIVVHVPVQQTCTPVAQSLLFSRASSSSEQAMMVDGPKKWRIGHKIGAAYRRRRVQASSEDRSECDFRFSLRRNHIDGVK